MSRRRRRLRLATGGGGFAIGAWTAGVNTTLSFESGDTRARATINAGANPRISRQVTGLVVGATYRLNTSVFIGTVTGGMRTRVSATQNLTLADYGEEIDSSDGTSQIDFVAPAGGTVFFGIVGVSSGVGQFCECNIAPLLTKL